MKSFVTKLYPDFWKALLPDFCNWKVGILILSWVFFVYLILWRVFYFSFYTYLNAVCNHTKQLTLSILGAEIVLTKIKIHNHTFNKA